MALIKCSECGKDVSSNAPSCLNCGNPINQQVPTIVRVQTDPNNPLKIEPELTSKKWKRGKMAAWGLIIFGIIFMFTGEVDFGRPGFGFGFTLAFVGIIYLVISKIGAWYEDRQAR